MVRLLLLLLLLLLWALLSWLKNRRMSGVNLLLPSLRRLLLQGSA